MRIKVDHCLFDEDAVVLDIPDEIWHKCADKKALLDRMNDLVCVLDKSGEFGGAYLEALVPKFSGWYVKLVEGSEIAVLVRLSENQYVYDFGGMIYKVENDGSWVRFLGGANL